MKPLWGAVHGCGDIVACLPCAGHRKKTAWGEALDQLGNEPLFRPTFSPPAWGGTVMSPFSFLGFGQSTKQLPGVTLIFIWHLLSVRHVVGVGYMLGAYGLTRHEIFIHRYTLKGDCVP